MLTIIWCLLLFFFFMPLPLFVCHHTMFIIMLLLYHTCPWNHHHEALFCKLEVMLLFSGGTRAHMSTLLSILLHVKVIIFHEIRHHVKPRVSYLNVVFVSCHLMHYRASILERKFGEIFCHFRVFTAYCMKLGLAWRSQACRAVSHCIVCVPSNHNRPMFVLSSSNLKSSVTDR